MKSNTFLSNYQHLQYQIMYNRLIDLKFASIAWCGAYDSAFFNHALIDQPIGQCELGAISKEMISLKRTPAVYFENDMKFSGVTKLLEENGFEKTWEDSWMFHNGENLSDMDFSSIKSVNTETELEIFLETFNRCYQKDDPQNPYGELGDYLIVAKEAWMRHGESKKIEYFTIFDGSTPVAVSTLTNFAGIGYISNVGSLQSVRGRGFGKLASLSAVYHSKENGNNLHCLATEEGDYPFEFYQRIGFKTKFSALGYVKEEL